MSAPRFNLIVIRVADLETAAAFYKLLGFGFEKHAHGSGPEHYSAETNGVVFELYPATNEQPVSATTRLGFQVANVNELVSVLSAFPGVKLVATPRESEWGRRAEIADPDGHRIELLERG